MERELTRLWPAARQRWDERGTPLGQMMEEEPAAVNKEDRHMSIDERQQAKLTSSLLFQSEAFTMLALHNNQTLFTVETKPQTDRTKASPFGQPAHSGLGQHKMAVPSLCTRQNHARQEEVLKDVDQLELLVELSHQLWPKGEEGGEEGWSKGGIKGTGREGKKAENEVTLLLHFSKTHPSLQIILKTRSFPALS